ncbi:MAG TPA: ROK family protein [Steroidobacteraceae bacterium]|jgi:polyphosphate glucokinase|nr:ROK family protein [Steroidobacteraceae bacterium]
MPRAQKNPRRGTPRRILVIDVGGAHVKFRVDAHGRSQKFVSGPKMGPAHMVRQIRRLTRDTPYDAVSLGYPGPVVRGRIAAEPHNLGGRWVGFDFARALGRPVRIINDAAMQAMGTYRGGRMLFLGLGTGLGVALIVDGEVEATEFGHLPYKRGGSYEDYAGERGRERRGNKKWRKSVRDIIVQLRAVFEADYVVLGGGNAVRMKKLPPGTRLGDNQNAFTGGLRLWRGGFAGVGPRAHPAHRKRSG